MESLFYFIVGLAIGVVAILAQMVYQRHKMTTRLIKHINETITELKKVVVPCRLEIENDVIYMYRKDTGLFLAKGNSLKQINDFLAESYPDKLFDVDSDEILEAKVITKINERKTNVSAS